MGRIGIAFLIGHCCIHMLSSLPDRSYVIVLILALVLALWLRSILVAALAFGIAWSWGHAADRLSSDLPASLEGIDVVVRGYVGSLPEDSNGDLRFLFDLIDRGPGIPKRVQITWYKASNPLAVGERWQFTVRLKRRNGFANPGGFDYEAYLFRDGVGATGYVRSGEDSRRLAVGGTRYPVDQLREWIAKRMRESVSDTSMLGILQGLAIGDTREMSADQWKVLAASGTTHLMAISGLHISMIAALVAWMGGAIVRWPCAQARAWCAVQGQAVAGSLAALTYALLAGFSVPTQRTLIMLCVYFAARWYRRTLSVGHALGLSLVAVLLVDPFAPLAVGAWLSFSAVAVILIAMSGRLIHESALVGFTRVQFAITIGLLPLLLVLFGSLSLISPLANAVAIPFFTLVVVPLVLIGACCAMMSTQLAALPLDGATWLLRVFWNPLEWLGQQPAALWHVPSIGAVSLAAMVVGALLLLVPAIWPMRVLGVFLCSHVMWISGPRPLPGEFELAVLDVGQGLACVVRTHSRVLVFDTGPAFQSGRDAADLAVLPYLHSYGVQQIDLLAVSHGDLDHQGGMRTLAHGLRVTESLIGPSVRTDIANVEICAKGRRWEWDGVQFQILHPAAGYHGTDNDSSCVLLVEGQAGTALLTGDIEASGEEILLQSWSSPVDVVVVPHHGSRTSSTQDFVKALAPEIAIFSAGYRNRWGMPKGDVIERWKQVGARTFSTARSGAIEISIGADRPWVVREHRRLNRRYWSRPIDD